MAATILDGELFELTTAFRASTIVLLTERYEQWGGSGAGAVTGLSVTSKFHRGGWVPDTGRRLNIRDSYFDSYNMTQSSLGSWNILVPAHLVNLGHASEIQ